MEKANILGSIAASMTIMYACCGLPIQIRKNHLLKSTEGLSLFMMSFAFLSLFCWMTYAIVKTPKDWFIFVSNAPGAFFALIILVQCFIYRQRKTHELVGPMVGPPANTTREG